MEDASNVIAPVMLRNDDEQRLKFLQLIRDLRVSRTSYWTTVTSVKHIGQNNGPVTRDCFSKNNIRTARTWEWTNRGQWYFYERANKLLKGYAIVLHLTTDACHTNLITSSPTYLKPGTISSVNMVYLVNFGFAAWCFIRQPHVHRRKVLLFLNVMELWLKCHLKKLFFSLIQ